MIISQNVNNKFLNLKLDMVSQELLDYKNLADCTPKEEIQNNPLKELREQLTKTQIKVLDSLFFYKTKHKILFPSHDRIAKRSNCSRKTVMRAMKKLSALGLVSIFFRQDETCLYKISPFFFDFYRLYSLKPLLKSIKGNIIKLSLLLLPLAMLTSSYLSHDSENVPRVNNKCKFINKPSLAIHCQSNVENGKVGVAKKLTSQKIEKKRESSNPSTIFNRSSGYMPDTKSQIIDRLEIRLGLAAEDKKRLEQFETNNLLKAEYRLATASNLKDPIAYLFGMCFKMQQEGSLKSTDQVYNKPKSYNSGVPKLTPEEEHLRQEKKLIENKAWRERIEARRKLEKDERRSKAAILKRNDPVEIAEMNKKLEEKMANQEKSELEKEVAKSWEMDSAEALKFYNMVKDLPEDNNTWVLREIISKNLKIIDKK